VLSRATGFSRQYGRNPYYGYDDPDTRPFFRRGDGGQNSALEGADTSKGGDVGSVGAFRADGGISSFRADGPSFIDLSAGSEWDITGRAISGPLAGERLTVVPHLDTFWFAWSTYQSGTTLFER